MLGWEVTWECRCAIISPSRQHHCYILWGQENFPRSPQEKGTFDPLPPVMFQWGYLNLWQLNYWYRLEKLYVGFMSQTQSIEFWGQSWSPSRLVPCYSALPHPEKSSPSFLTLPTPLYIALATRTSTPTLVRQCRPSHKCTLHALWQTCDDLVIKSSNP